MLESLRLFGFVFRKIRVLISSFCRVSDERHGVLSNSWDTNWNLCIDIL